jgi:hypothetical protein
LHRAAVPVAAGPLANAAVLVRKLALAAGVALGVTPAGVVAMLLARISVSAQRRLLSRSRRDEKELTALLASRAMSSFKNGSWQTFRWVLP